MYINNLIFTIAARSHNECVLESDNAYHLIYVISKYQKQLINDDKNTSQPEIYLTVAEAVSNLLNSANADIQMLSAKEPEFSSFVNFKAMDRLNDYYDDLTFLNNFIHLWSDYSHEEKSLISSFNKTIANINKELRHSNEILQTSLDELVLPKLKEYISEKNTALDKDLVAQMEIKQLTKFIDLYTTKNNIIKCKRREEEQGYSFLNGYKYSTPKYHIHIKNGTINSLNAVLNEASLKIEKSNNTQKENNKSQFNDNMELTK